MPLNLIKLCVGCDTPDELLEWRAALFAPGGAVSVVHTRQTPKRAAELLDGGSLYWVFKGAVLVRQRIDIIETIAEGGRNRCEITLEDVLIATAPQPRRPFQGWRYLLAKDAPGDLPHSDAGEGMPQDLAKELRELGAW
jgi:hypothetical protein